MRKFLITWWMDRRDRKRVLEWVRDEWEQYADARNDGQLQAVEEYMRISGVTGDSWWNTVVNQYLHRAAIFGLETPEGRQQVMKAVATMIDLGACVVRVYGDPPAPGKPSGPIVKQGEQ